ncbi:MAG: hypothetical protein ACXV8S_05075 [Methylobacter sp.]
MGPKPRHNEEDNHDKAKTDNEDQSVSFGVRRTVPGDSAYYCLGARHYAVLSRRRLGRFVDRKGRYYQGSYRLSDDAQFLFIFFLLFRQYAIEPPVWVVAACCFGAFFNPLSFLVRGLTPKPSVTIPVEAHFPFQAGLSFTLTTIGFLTAVALVVRAVLQERAGRD